MIKSGDELLCKKSFKDLKRNETYSIYRISKHKTVIINTREDKFPLLFDLDKDTPFFEYLWDYFYTPLELRKMKLQQLEYDEARR